MPATRQTGTRIRTLQDWYDSDMSGGHALQNGVAGQFSEIGLFNNAQDGTVLRVYAVSVAVASAMHVGFEYVKGQPAAAYAPETFVPLKYPVTAGQYGVVMAFTSSVCLGAHFGGVEGAVSNPQIFNPGWPIAIIQPGWSWLMEGGNANVFMEADFWYLQARY